MRGLKQWIALLRGINVGGHNRIAMAELRATCSKLGWRDVRTYIQSGNIVFTADGDSSALEDLLQTAVRERFGHDIQTIVRGRDDWSAHLSDNPFPEASEQEPNLVMLGLSKSMLAGNAAEALQARAAAEERVVGKNGALWIHYANGSARSKLTPALLDRLAGSPVTTRNWRTVSKLAEMLKAH
jgi:uncharacterized protein (DUF1697 family)